MLYSVMIHSADAVFENLPPEEQATVLQKHREVQAELEAKNKLGPVAKLMGTHTAVTLRAEGEEVIVTDGPFSESKEQFLGLYFIEGDSLEEVIEVVKKLPQHTSIYEIRPVEWMGGADLGSNGSHSA